ncbi:hypothetical protein LV779_11260 [Streptomyces thinghirensis]|nr:hypothetical protein [Streptomyces thinghirensis]
MHGSGARGQLLSASGRGTQGHRSAGVRATRASGTGPWEVDVQVVVHRGHRALTVARAVRDPVAAALAETAPGAQVTVTVTNAV